MENAHVQDAARDWLQGNRGAISSALQTYFDFWRTLIEEEHISGGVTIEVLTQANEEMIRRTFESLSAAREVIVHIYNATSRVFRQTVFCTDKAGAKKIPTDTARFIKQLADQPRKPSPDRAIL